ncbi:MAG: hypothetical protein ACOCUD_03810 [Bacillota bacterium]
MDRIYKELEEFRKIYFEALKNKDPDVAEMRMKMNEMEQLIEENLSSIQVKDVDRLVEKMKANVNEATKKIRDINDKTTIVANTIKFIDDTLYFVKDIL